MTYSERLTRYEEAQRVVAEARRNTRRLWREYEAEPITPRSQAYQHAAAELISAEAGTEDEERTLLKSVAQDMRSARLRAEEENET